MAQRDTKKTTAKSKPTSRTRAPQKSASRGASKDDSSERKPDRKTERKPGASPFKGPARNRSSASGAPTRDRTSGTAGTSGPATRGRKPGPSNRTKAASEPRGESSGRKFEAPARSGRPAPKGKGRGEGPRSEGPRSEGPRSETSRSKGPRGSTGPRIDSSRSKAPRSTGPRSSDSAAPRSALRSRTDGPSFRKAPSRGEDDPRPTGRAFGRTVERDTDRPKTRTFDRNLEREPGGRKLGREFDREPSGRDFFERGGPAGPGGERKRPPVNRDFYIWGRRPVEAFLADLHSKGANESLAAKYGLHIIIDKNGKAPAQLKVIVESAQTLGLKIKLHKSQTQEDEWPLGEEEILNHQRVCLKTPAFPTHDISEALAIVRSEKANDTRGCIGVVIDSIQDPRNFGAILRSAAFFGSKFVIFAQDRQAEVTPLVIRTSAGGAFALKLVPVVNISRALSQLKDAGAWIATTSVNAKAIAPRELPMDRPYAVVFGNEGKGVRPEVAKHADFTLRIPGGTSTVDSLNVSVAAGVVLSHIAPAADSSEAQTADSDDDDDE